MLVTAQPPALQREPGRLRNSAYLFERSSSSPGVRTCSQIALLRKEPLSRDRL